MWSPSAAVLVQVEGKNECAVWTAKSAGNRQGLTDLAALIDPEQAKGKWVHARYTGNRHASLNGASALSAIPVLELIGYVEPTEMHTAALAKWLEVIAQGNLKAKQHLEGAARGAVAPAQPMAAPTPQFGGAAQMTAPQAPMQPAAPVAAAPSFGAPQAAPATPQMPQAQMPEQAWGAAANPYQK